MRTLRPARITHDGSDSDDNLDLSHHTWTRAGGPLMRTASAVKFVMYYDGDADSLTPSTTPQDPQPKSEDESDAIKLRRPGSGESRSGNRKNKIWDIKPNPNETEMNCPSSPDDGGFSLRQQQPTMRKSASAFLEKLAASDGDMQPRQTATRCQSIPTCVCAAVGRNASCECSEPDSSFLFSKTANPTNWHETDLGSAEISMREALRATSPHNQSEACKVVRWNEELSVLL